MGVSYLKGMVLLLDRSQGFIGDRNSMFYAEAILSAFFGYRFLVNQGNTRPTQVTKPKHFGPHH